MNPFEIAKLAAKVLDAKKADDVLYIDVSQQTIVADYFVIAGAGTSVHAKALCDYVEEELSKQGIEPSCIDGYSDGRWIVLDYRGVFVHIFRKEERDFYRLERLWENGSNTVHFN